MSHPGTGWTLAEQHLESLQDQAWRPCSILDSSVQESPWGAGASPAHPPGKLGCTWNLCGRDGKATGDLREDVTISPSIHPKETQTNPVYLHTESHLHIEIINSS